MSTSIFEPPNCSIIANVLSTPAAESLKTNHFSSQVHLKGHVFLKPFFIIGLQPCLNKQWIPSVILGETKLWTYVMSFCFVSLCKCHWWWQAPWAVASSAHLRLQTVKSGKKHALLCAFLTAARKGVHISLALTVMTTAAAKLHSGMNYLTLFIHFHFRFSNLSHLL